MYCLDDLIESKLESNLRNQCLYHLNHLASILLCPDKHTVFFVGAGISCPSPACLPTAIEFVSMIVDAFDSHDDIDQSQVREAWHTIHALCTEGVYLPLEFLMESLYGCIGENSLDLLRVYRIANPKARYNPVHDFLASWAKLRGCPIITTNFDELIEGAFYDRFNTAMTVGYKEDQYQMAAGCASYDLYKLHGTASDRESQAVTFSQIGARLPPAKETILSKLVSENNGCIVGWAAGDLDIVPAMVEAVAQSIHNGHHWYFILYPRENNFTLCDYYRSDPTAISFCQTLNMPLIIAKSEGLFRRLYPRIFGGSLREGSGPSEDLALLDTQTKCLVRQWQCDMEQRTLSHQIASHILHRVEGFRDLTRAEEILAEAVAVHRRASVTAVPSLYLARSHIAFDANHAIRALDFAEKALATAQAEDIVLRSAAYFGIATQLLAPNWLRDLRASKHLRALPSMVRRLACLPFYIHSARALLIELSKSRDLSQRRSAELQLGSLEARRIATIIHILTKVVGWPLFAPFRRSWESRLSKSLTVHRTYNDLHGQYDTLRWRARLFSSTQPERAIQDIEEARRLCRSMCWPQGLGALSALERRIKH